jgi:predicted RNA binding protein YcfA (HicA-like mRNA interferase family)
MTPDELKRKLAKNGWAIDEGRNHSQATHPDRPGLKIPIPRHKGRDIPKGTLNEILKAAGLK